MNNYWMKLLLKGIVKRKPGLMNAISLNYMVTEKNQIIKSCLR